MAVAGKFRIDGLLGRGSYGEVFKGTNVRTREEVAIKRERKNARHARLPYEAKIYRKLHGNYGIPNVHWSGVEDDSNCLVLDLLGPSLQDLLEYCNCEFSLKTVLMLADQLISRFEVLHESGFLHRDVKPANFVMGLGKKAHVVHMIDFGLAKKFLDEDGEHIPYREDKAFSGTARYASIHAHLGFESSRRDDLESLGYLLIFLLRGSLPWQGVMDGCQPRHQLVAERKMSTPIEKLCEGLPREFVEHFRLCRELRFVDKPDYSQFRQNLRNVFRREKFCLDHVFTWSRVKAELVEQVGQSNNQDQKSLDPDSGSSPCPLADRSPKLLSHSTKPLDAPKPIYLSESTDAPPHCHSHSTGVLSNVRQDDMWKESNLLEDEHNPGQT